MSSCESPLVDPTMEGAPPVVTETSFDRSKPFKAGRRALRTSLPVVVAFIEMRLRKSSTTFMSCVTPRTKMTTCAVSLMSQLSSKAIENISRLLNFVSIEDRTSEAKSSTRRVAVRADSGIAMKASCCSGQMVGGTSRRLSILRRFGSLLFEERRLLIQLWLQASSFSLALIRGVIFVRMRVFRIEMPLEIWPLESVVVGIVA